MIVGASYFPVLFQWENKNDDLTIIASLIFDIQIILSSNLLSSTLPKGWTWYTYRQGSAELGISERPKNTFPLTEKAPKILSENQNPKIYPPKTGFI